MVVGLSGIIKSGSFGFSDNVFEFHILVFGTFDQVIEVRDISCKMFTPMKFDGAATDAWFESVNRVG